MIRDLNLLLVFEALWIERSVTKAGERMGVSQAAASTSLKRMREEYNDKLFTLVGRRMEPTPLATLLAPQLLKALSLIRGTKHAGEAFDPICEKRTFVIRTRDVGEVVCLPGVIRAMTKLTPNIQIRTLFSPLADTVVGMGDGSIDLALGVLPTLEASIHKRRLLMQNYVCVLRKGHPLEKVSLTKELLKDREHLLVEYSGSGHASIERELIKLSGAESIRVRMPQYLAAPHFVTKTDLLWVAPEILAETLAKQYDFVVKKLPIQFPNFEVALYWHERYHKDPGNKWLRDFIAAQLRLEFDRKTVP